MSNIKLNFLKPADAEGYKADRSDVEGINSTSFVFNPYIDQSLDRQRKRLPVFSNRNHILYLAEKYQTVIVVGETGSGKSTQLPQYLYEAGWGADGLIGVTQPRRVACTTLASRVAEEMNVFLGQEVGYTIRFDDCISPGVTKIKYLTEGILIHEMMADPLLRQYAIIIFDEVHERTLYTDTVLGLMCKILKKRRKLKMIVCSATLDAEEFYHFFNFNKGKDKEHDTAVIVTIQGRGYPLEIFYRKDPIPDYVKASVDAVTKIHSSDPPGHILVFLTGVEEVDQCVSLLQQQAAQFTEKSGSLQIVPMHGSLSNSAQLKAFLRVPHGVRKVVVATNIAETSVTIPEIVYVVDCGFVKLRWYNCKSHTDSLIVVPISKASATQRAGRAGRTRTGKVYRLYSEEEFNKLEERTTPEMVRSYLGSAVLNLMALGIENMLRFNFPSPPPAEHLATALDELFALKALSDDGKLSVPLGERLAELPLPPRLGKILLVSGEYKCSKEILSIVALLQVDNVFLIPAGKAPEAKAKHHLFKVSEGDLLTLLNVYCAYEQQENPKKWCNEHFINYRSLQRSKTIRSSIEKLLQKFEIPVISAEGNTDAVCRCIAEGLFPNAAYLHHSGSYRTIRGDQTLQVHPSSVLYVEKPAACVLFNELLHTSELYMRDLTAIDPQWLLELAPHFYIKSTVYDT